MCRIIKWRWYRCFKKHNQEVHNKTGVDREELQQAGEELRQAYQVLSRVEDVDMVDYAVFTLKAAEKRYGYLLRKLKEEEKQNQSFGEVGQKVKSLNC